MKLSKDYKYNILCEDKLTHCFIRRFLISQGVNSRKINALPLSAAGCGEQYVREQYPKRLNYLRSNNFISNILVVAIDADINTCIERQKQLDEACENASVDKRTSRDKLFLLIPKRNIETWIKYFDGENVDEEHDYAHFLNGHESDCYNAADKMADEFSSPSFSSVLSSLQFAFKEYTNLVKLIS